MNVRALFGHLSRIGPAAFAAIGGAAALVAATTWSVEVWVGKGRVEHEKQELTRQLATAQEELNAIKNQDQYKINQLLASDIKHIETTYTQAVASYENLLELKETAKDQKDTRKLDEQFTGILALLAKRQYASAAAELTGLTGAIKAQRDTATSSFTLPENAPQTNAPPGSGYSRQVVKSDSGDYLVDLVAADLASTRVLVDTASEKDCKTDCPVLPLTTYVSRTGAYAGINGSYFCPATYPSCADKKNSFDTLLMNKNKVYFNSDNNVYSVVPAAIFGSGWIRFVSRSLDWGRDTGIDSMIANQPLLLMGGNVTFGGDEDPKKGSKGARSFVAKKENTVYIGVVHNATVAESARVMKALGMGDALNLDSGGSTALWSGGYKVGPGRDLPNAILFVRK